MAGAPRLCGICCHGRLAPHVALSLDKTGHCDVVLARIPAKWNHFAEKDSRQINILEQILIAKVFNFGGILL
jgi:hypothetical protein